MVYWGLRSWQAFSCSRLMCTVLLLREMFKGFRPSPLPRLESQDALPLATRMET